MLELAKISLDDKYTSESGRIYVSGTQALARLPLLLRRRDVLAGIDSGIFISGYRGSPLGGYDSALWQAEKYFRDQGIVFQPGLNEDLAATAMWGTQQVGLAGRSHKEGVTGIWYGKGPGVDRSVDALKHGNLSGTSPHGGVLVLFGDDHTAKSSSVAHQSEPSLIAAGIPMLNPASVQEYLDYGQYAVAMSRYAGCWVGMKCLTDTVDSSASVSVDPDRVHVVLPADHELPRDGVHIRWPDMPAPQEQRLYRHKLPAAQAFVRVNRLDRITHDLPPEQRRLGIVATGKGWGNVVDALQQLTIDEATRAAFGITIYKVAMPWPLEPEGVLDYAAGHDEILVVEEKRGLIEEQLARVLYGASTRPRLLGKQDESGRPLLPVDSELTVDLIASVLVDRLAKLDLPEAHIAALRAKVEAVPTGASVAANGPSRSPWFCAGCPHNTSTRIPDGSRAFAGIGCHGMAMYMPNRRTESFTQMGGDGAQWIGHAPFSKDRHVFQNLGDGTYHHSGSLAIRAAVAAGINITFKILYNDAVAMTGGQPVEGSPTPWAITRQVHAEGVERIVVVMDDVKKYPAGTRWAEGVTLRTRDEIDAVQRELREIKGVTVLLYDQTCATEKRRRRKRGKLPDAGRRVVINEAVCEGCGDCGVASNCVAVRPLETAFGRKRQIDQAACNQDLSCVEGFCPSFVTVHGAAGQTPIDPSRLPDDVAAGLPEPVPCAPGDGYNILVTGIGGTGVVTVSAVLGMAAHLEGRGVSVLDQTGLSQKNGAVMSYVRIAARQEDLHSTRIARGQADLLLGCDMMVATNRPALDVYSAGRTRAVVNDHLVPPANFALEPDMPMDSGRVVDTLVAALGKDALELTPANRFATALIGDSIYSNIFLIGFAWQRGLIPLRRDAIERAIELNGVSVASNRLAFDLGRRAAHAPDEVAAMLPPLLANAPEPGIDDGLDALIAHRVSHLTGYQNAAYAGRYETFVRRAQAVEAERTPGFDMLARAIARNYAKLMSYKDEYEVARLYARTGFMQRIDREFGKNLRVTVHLAPPLLARRDPLTGKPHKREYGPWMFKAFDMLARLRFLRGTPFDPFGHTSERKTERRLIQDYETMIEEVLTSLNPDNHEIAVRLASIPERIRGFGHVKERHLDEATKLRAELFAQLRGEVKQVTLKPLEKIAL